jgi:hypothetical protein
MKKIPALFVILLLVSYACKDSVYEPYNNNFSDFFPNSNGNYYHYNVSVSDTNGTTLQLGERRTYYNGDTIIFSIKNQIRVDSFQLGSLESINNSYFRKDEFGVYNAVDVDTNGFYFLLPDSLRGNISFPIQYPILHNTMKDVQTWHLFDAWADIPQFLAFNVEAEIVSLDTFFIPNQSQTRFTDAYNIKYSASLITGVNQPPKLFEVHGWFAKGIGPVKWEGDSELINFFAGADIYPMNTSVLEELNSFKVY